MTITYVCLTGFPVTAVDIALLTLKLVEKAADELGYEVNNSDGAKIHTQVSDVIDFSAPLLLSTPRARIIISNNTYPMNIFPSPWTL